MSVQVKAGLQLTTVLADYLASNIRHSVVGFTFSCCVVGCGQPADIMPVHGQILFRGKPLEYGSVMFQPTEEGELARGKLQEDGTFVLTTNKTGDGVKIGTSRVRVTAYEAQRPGGSKPAGADEPTLGRSAIPTKYQNFGTSELIVEVGVDMELPVVLDLE